MTRPQCDLCGRSTGAYRVPQDATICQPCAAEESATDAWLAAHPPKPLTAPEIEARQEQAYHHELRAMASDIGYCDGYHD